MGHLPGTKRPVWLEHNSMVYLMFVVYQLYISICTTYMEIMASQPHFNQADSNFKCLLRVHMPCI